MIDKQSGIPIYIQIQSEIKKKMEDGVWKVGTSIPAERQLAEMFHVSRMTVDKPFKASLMITFCKGVLVPGLLLRKRN